MSGSFGKKVRGRKGGRGRGGDGSGGDNVIPFLRYLRLEVVLKLYPVSEQSWRRGVESGRYPRPQKIGGLEVWRRADIRALCDWFAGKREGYPDFPVEDPDDFGLPLLDRDFDDD